MDFLASLELHLAVARELERSRQANSQHHGSDQESLGSQTIQTHQNVLASTRPPGVDYREATLKGSIGFARDGRLCDPHQD